jgi:membrane fusion protein YbhG
MTRKSLLLVAFVVGLALAALGFFWPFSNGPEELRFPGIIEIQEVKLGSKVKGRVYKVFIDEGDRVKPLDRLIELEIPDLEAQRDQWQAQVKEAKAEAQTSFAKLWRVMTGWRQEEIDQAAADLSSAEAMKEQTEKEYKRLLKLLPEKGVSQAEFDTAKGAFDNAKGRFYSNLFRFEMMSRGNRDEDKLEALSEWQRLSAKHEEMQARLREAEVNVREKYVIVPENLGSAVVTVLPVRPGDLVDPGQPLVRVLRTQEMWVRFYVPETQLGKVQLHQSTGVSIKPRVDDLINRKVDVTIDAYGSYRFTGTIYQVNPISEFLPRNVQSKEERRHQVFGCKVKIDNPKDIFHAGMAAEVIITVGPP